MNPKARIVVAAALMLCACAPATRAVVPSAEADLPDAVVGGDRVRVERVVDGDTIAVWLGGRSVRVRLIGVDTPETVDPRRPAGCYGREASAFAAQTLAGRDVVLTYDVDRVDRYGRTLAYVYLPDGTFVNLDLVRLGYATVSTVPPNVTHARRFLDAQRYARERKLGLWNPAVCPVR